MQKNRTGRQNISSSLSPATTLPAFQNLFRNPGWQRTQKRNKTIKTCTIASRLFLPFPIGGTSRSPRPRPPARSGCPRPRRRPFPPWTLICPCSLLACPWRRRPERGGKRRASPPRRPPGRSQGTAAPPSEGNRTGCRSGAASLPASTDPPQRPEKRSKWFRTLHRRTRSKVFFVRPIVPPYRYEVLFPLPSSRLQCG